MAAMAPVAGQPAKAPGNRKSGVCLGHEGKPVSHGTGAVPAWYAVTLRKSTNTGWQLFFGSLPCKPGLVPAFVSAFIEQRQEELDALAQQSQECMVYLRTPHKKTVGVCSKQYQALTAIHDGRPSKRPHSSTQPLQPRQPSARQADEQQQPCEQQLWALQEQLESTQQMLESNKRELKCIKRDIESNNAAYRRDLLRLQAQHAANTAAREAAWQQRTAALQQRVEDLERQLAAARAREEASTAAGAAAVVLEVPC